MSEIISDAFYSNCFIEAMKRKIRHPIRTKITYIRPRYGESYFFVPHFLWSDGEYDYDFGVERWLKPWEVFFFKGYIRQRSLGWNSKYKQNRIKKYNSRKGKNGH